MLSTSVHQRLNLKADTAILLRKKIDMYELILFSFQQLLIKIFNYSILDHINGDNFEKLGFFFENRQKKTPFRYLEKGVLEPCALSLG